MRTGLKGAAVTHTRNGQAALEQADQTGDPKEKLRLTTYALQEYKLAAHRLARLPQAGRERARRVQEPVLLRRRAPQRGAPPGRAARVRPEGLSRADLAGDRDRRAGCRRRSRLRRGRPVHRQRGSLRGRPRRRRSRPRVPALAGLGRYAGSRTAQGPEARGLRGRQEGRRRRVPRRHPDVDEGARRVHPARPARARQAEPRRGLRVLRGRPVLPLRALQGGASRDSRRSTRSAAARTRSATRRGSASSS